MHRFPALLSQMSCRWIVLTQARLAHVAHASLCRGAQAFDASVFSLTYSNHLHNFELNFNY